MAVLPAMKHRPETKTGNEVGIYYNLGVGKIISRLSVDGEIIEAACGSAEDCPAGSFNATVLESALVPVQNAFGAFPANSPLWTAFEDKHVPIDDGVFANYVCLPNPADDVLICFDQGFAPTLGTTFRPVPRKFQTADHYVRQRPENSLTISDFFVSNWNGVSRIRGRRVTIVIKVFPQGGSTPSEIQYYSNVMLNASPITTQADGNANIEISGEGAFNFAAIFSEPPA